MMRTLLGAVVLAGVLGTTGALGKITEEDAARLGTTLTPLGAEKAGNKDGSLPAWTGTLQGLPEGLEYGGPGTPYPDLYAHDEKILTITAENMNQYADRLTVGQRTLLATYPQTYRIDVYPSHRDAAVPARLAECTRYNALHAELYGGDDGIRGYTGGVPFPIPKSGAEAMWNGRTSLFFHVLEGQYDDVATFPNGTQSQQKASIITMVPYNDPSKEVGWGAQNLTGIGAYTLDEKLDPPRDKGSITLVLEPYDYVINQREAWRYLPGSRRVRRAPTVGYDTPSGPNGLITVDDTLGFNGSMNRFEWQLIGKKEIYIPYHNYRFDTPDVSYKELLPRFHANPDYLRHELHRVWIVEAQLREGKRHVYQTRRFYLDEDSWLIVATENYDSRDELWKISFVTSIYEFNLGAYVQRAFLYTDLQVGAYFANRLVNQLRPFDFTAEPKPVEYFTPTNVRKLGKR